MKVAGGLALAVVALMLYGVAYGAGGQQFKEPPDFSCLAHAPEGMGDETTRVVVSESALVPPHLSCSFTRHDTGRTATWDSGNASLPWFVASLGAGLAAVVVTAAGLLGAVSSRSGSREH